MNIKGKINKYGLKKCILFGICAPFYNMIKLVYLHILKSTKIDDKYILFSSSPDFSDNAKELYRFFLENYEGKGYKYIWLIKKDSYRLGVDKENNTLFIREFSNFHHGLSLKAIYYILKSKIVFFTHASPFSTLKKRADQVVVNLWHGCGYKAAENKKKNGIEENPFDYALVPGKIFVKTKSVFWGCSEEKVLPIGYPRYDLLLKENDSTKNFARKLLGGNDKLVIWMPTFRKTEFNVYPEEKIVYNFDLPLLESEEDLESLDNLCRKNRILLCIKRHLFQLKYSCEHMKFTNIIFLSNDDLAKENVDLYSLLRYTDSLITDYSSVAIDYLLLNKPINFILQDFENYKSVRGFVFDDPKKYMPGNHIYSFDDLKKCIEDIAMGKDLYLKIRKEIIAEVHNRSDNYCKRVCEFIKEQYNIL